VYVNHDNQIVIVDGHCRNEALQAAIADGAEIEWVPIVEFEGNDADRVAFMFTSSQGKALTQYEQAEAFKRLRSFNWTVKAISQRCGKSESTVNKLLALANADSDIKGMVAAGEVSTDAALKVMRKAKGNAGKVLAKKVADAKASVRNTTKGAKTKAAKVTAKDVTSATIPLQLQEHIMRVAVLAEVSMSGETLAQLVSLQGMSLDEFDGEYIEIPTGLMVAIVECLSAVQLFNNERAKNEQ
jgi:ParB-like chromosome segregation protein Spo0J